jgi:SagB-type dehydrogenase family enzyme
MDHGPDSATTARIMKINRALLPLTLLPLLVAGGDVMYDQSERDQTATATRSDEPVLLPPPACDGATSVEAALAARRSQREYQATPLTQAEIGQLLWAAQGVSGERGQRTAPSAGALYPLEVYLIAGRIDGLSAGVYHYLPAKHALLRTIEGDRRAALSRAALDQEALQQAPATIALVAIYERTTGKYGERGVRYVHMDVGAAAENVCLQAEALSLGTVYIGAFQDEQVQDVLHLPDDWHPLTLLPVGHPRTAS